MKTKHNDKRGKKAGSLRSEEQEDTCANTIKGKDYTSEILAFLQESHGRVRIDNHHDYYYEGVSTLSLHFLLRSQLPGKELLWRWYQHFENTKAEDIYQTLPPQRDGEFLDILDQCDFSWNRETVRESGLVFLPEHRTEVYLGLEEWLSMRLEEYETMDDVELADVLQPKGTWSDPHLRKLVRRVQTQPLEPEQRHRIYQQFESDYLRATARHMLDEAQHEYFWKSPPPELESLHNRFVIFSRTMANTARRLGVYVSRRDYDSGYTAGTGKRKAEQAWRFGGYQKPGRGKAQGANGNGHAAGYYATLGLTPEATLDDVKLAYRDQVKLHHPDQGGSVEDFLLLQEAYEYLLTQVYSRERTGI